MAKPFRSVIRCSTSNTTAVASRPSGTVMSMGWIGWPSALALLSMSYPFRVRIALLTTRQEPAHTRGVSGHRSRVPGLAKGHETERGRPMTEVSLTVRASREQVFAVLADGWSFAGWVVGASHIRDVDPGWPAVGSRIHHSVGPWPLVVSDVTVVREVQPPRLIELDARLWPLGAARVRLELDDVAPD